MQICNNLSVSAAPSQHPYPFCPFGTFPPVSYTHLVDAIVLGCTHYPFLTGAIRRIVGRGPEILDGSHGVAMQLGRRLAAAGMLLSLIHI